MVSRLETTRLLLKPTAPDDLSELHRLWNDRELRRYLFDGRATSLEEARALLEASEVSFAERGMGLWRVDRLEDGRMAGFAGFLHAEAGPPDLVYGLWPSLWGNGYATEAARAVIERAFQVPTVEFIVASVDEPNTASIEVLHRLGMRHTRRAVVDGKPLLYYELVRELASG